MLKSPKQRPDTKKRRWIATLPCLNCLRLRRVSALPYNTPTNDPAHIRTRARAGVAQKPSDARLVPLCHACHQEQHRIGEKAFWGSDMELAISTATALEREKYKTEDAMPAIRLWRWL